MARFLLTLVLAAGTSAFATAQTTGTTPGTGTGSGVQPTGNSGFTSATMEASPTISGGTGAGANVNASNAFAGYYANPLYAGRPGSTGIQDPGGFGSALSGGSGSASRTGAAFTNSRTGSTASRATSSTGSSLANSLGTTSGARTAGSTGGGITAPAAGQGFGSGFGGTTTGGRTGSTGGFGGTTGRNSGFGGGTTSTQQAGVIAPQSRPIAQSLTVRFTSPTLVPAAMASDLTGSLGRSSYLSNPGTINVDYDGKVVVLRGQVKDEEEARTAEGIVRLTPGVRTVKNELTYPKP